MRLFIKSVGMIKKPASSSAGPSIFIAPSGGKSHAPNPSPTSAGIANSSGAGSRGGKHVGTSSKGKLIYETEKKTRPGTGASGGAVGQTAKEFNKSNVMPLFIGVDLLIKSVMPGTVHTWADGESYRKEDEGVWVPVTVPGHKDHPVDENGDHVKEAQPIEGAKEVAHPWEDKYAKYLPIQKIPHADMAPEDVKVDTSGDVHSHWIFSYNHPKTGKTVNSYTPEYDRRNNAHNWHHITGFTNEIFDKMEKEVVGDYSDVGDYGTRHRENGIITHIMMVTGLRPSSDTRTTFGAATLRRDHVTIEGGVAHLSFIGKSNVLNEAKITDPKLVKALKEQLDPPYADAAVDSDRLFPRTTYKKVNDYIQALKGNKPTIVEKPFRAQSLRKRFGTKLACEFLDASDMPPPPWIDDPEKMQVAMHTKIMAVINKVANALNNTFDVARDNYIHPNVFKAWRINLGFEKAAEPWSIETIEKGKKKYGSTFDIAMKIPHESYTPVQQPEDEFEDTVYELPDWVKKLKKAKITKSVGSLPLFVGINSLVKGRKLEGRCKFQGLDISIENAAGSTRSGKDPDGSPWTTTMKYPYGYIRRTLGADGEHLDCYVGPHKDATYAYVIRQKLPWTGNYDEDKVMLGFSSKKSAKVAYLEHYNDPEFFHSMRSIPMDAFITLLKFHKGKKLKLTNNSRFMSKGTPLFIKGRGLRTEEEDAKLVQDRPIRFAGVANPSTPDDPAVGKDWHNEYTDEEETEASFTSPQSRSQAMRTNTDKSLGLFVVLE